MESILVADTFSGVLCFALIAALLVVGTVLRNRLPILQKSLMPASLIGGGIGFSMVTFDIALGYSASDFTVFAFHFFTLSFMSLVLTGKPNQQNSETRIALGGFWLSSIWVISLVLQALVGFVVIQTFNQTTEEPLSAYLGILVTHGFTQGPGQALALGDLWSAEYGVQYAVDFGLIYASLGFIAAFVVGVPTARWVLKRGLQTTTSLRFDQDFERGIFPPTQRPAAGALVTQPANVDSLAYHVGLVSIAYLLTHGYLQILNPWVAGTGFENIFSYNLFFFHGLIVSLAMRGLMDYLQLGHLIDDETQKRITGSSVDLMVTASLLSINFALLSHYWLPILAVVIMVTLVTALLCFFAARRLTHLGIERGLTIFGCCCGSTGSGVLLLRILDPNLATPVAKELAFFNIAILFLSFHILGVMAPILPSIPLIWTLCIYALTAIVGMFLVSLIGSKLNAPSSIENTPEHT
ncbi:MAG: sodium:glutamate symporter [Proteobacteria bacterium]|nr:sodium:glutamate symporter [Pseudomonadota bacterium]